MIDPVILNARKPKDDVHGHAMLNRMNERHGALHKWGFEHISMDKEKRILDIGYGGGQNIRNMCKYAPEAVIYGIDHSEACLKKSTEVNQEAIAAGRVILTQGTVQQLPYEPEFFDLVTAFETIYYWPDIERCFQNVYASLKPKGSFLICNEDARLKGNEHIAQALDMKFYDQDSLHQLLQNAGFRITHTYLHRNGKWICAVGRK